MKESIPCTVAILTKNSGKSLVRALKSVADFGEIIICDGGSTDETLAIARAAGARVIEQDPRFLYSDGRIRNFSGVRNQTLAAASYAWFFFLDSDEYIDQALVAEIRRKTEGEPAAYWVPRKYVYHDTAIDCSVSYPSQQMRLFHKAVAKEFIKDVHERIELQSGVTPLWLTQAMYVPVPDSAEEMIAKWRKYLAIENTRRVPLPAGQWLWSVTHDAAIGVRYLLRLARIMLFCRGTRLPVSYELARVWYQYQLIHDSFATESGNAMRIVRFLCTGAIGLSTNLGMFRLLYILGVPYLVGSVAAFSVAMVVGFLLQKYWTFEERSRERAQTQFIQYALLTLGNLVLNTFLVYALVEYGHAHYLLAQAMGAGAIAILSYFVYRRYIFASSL